MCPESFFMNLPHSLFAHLPSSARQVPAESHSLQEAVQWWGKAGKEDLGSCHHSAHCCVTLDKLLPLSGPWFLCLSESGLDRFPFSCDTLWVVLQSEIE